MSSQNQVFAQKVTEFELHQLKALQGIEKFGVYVWDMEGNHNVDDLSPSTIEKFVHSALRGAKIESVPFTDARGITGAPSLEVSVRVWQKRNVDSYAYSVIARFIQDAKLLRTNITHYSAIVWERDDIGHAEKNDLTLSPL